MADLFEHFVCVILSGGPTEPLVSMAELKANFERVIKSCAEPAMADDMSEAETKVMACIPALNQYRDDDETFFCNMICNYITHH